MGNVNYELMAATTIDADKSSNPLLADRLQGVSFHCVITGSPIGELKLQCSNDAGTIPEAGEHAATDISNWADVGDASLAVNGAGSYVLSTTDQFVRWMRLAYVSTSGTGSMVVRVGGRTVR